MKLNKLVLTFFVSMIALSVSTLSMSIAWYASSDIVQIAGIEMTIDSDKALLVSTKEDEGYAESIEASELMSIGEFAPRTSAYESEWMSKKAQMPVFYDEANYNPADIESVKSVSDHGYFSQKLYLQSDDDIYVSISAEKTFIHANEAFNESYASRLYAQYQEGDDAFLKTLSKAEIKQRLDKLVKAMRFSLLVLDDDAYSYAIIDPYKEEDTYFGGLLDNDIDRYYDSYTSSVDGLLYERVYGEIIGDRHQIAYDDPIEEDSPFSDENDDPSAFNAKHKRGVKRFNLEQTIANGVKIRKEPSFGLKEFEAINKPFEFPVYRDKPTPVVLSIYIEGWDLDSVNYTMGATFVSEFSFKVEREMMI